MRGGEGGKGRRWGREDHLGLRGDRGGKEGRRWRRGTIWTKRRDRGKRKRGGDGGRGTFETKREDS